jgi:hypothetical protein
VVWYPRDRHTFHGGEVDGHAIHAGCLNNIEAHDFALSQRNRAALYCGDPQRWESGVDRGDGGPIGRIAATSGKDAAQLAADNAKTAKGWTASDGSALNSTRGPVKRRGPGIVLSSSNPDAKFGLLTLPPDSLDAIDGNAKDIRAKVQESLGVVDINLAEAGIAKDASGKALELLHRRQIDTDNRIREDFGDRCLLRGVQMLLRIILVHGRRYPGGLYLKNLATVLPILERFERPLAVANDAPADELLEGDVAPAPKQPPVMWVGPELDLVWGPFFRNQATDQTAVLKLVTDALTAKLITRRMAIEKLKSEGVFEIGSPEALIAAIAKDDAPPANDVDTTTDTTTKTETSEAEKPAPVADSADASSGDAAEPEPDPEKLVASMPAAAGAPPIELTPSDLATIFTVNEARKAKGYGPIADGELTVAAYKAKHAVVVAAAAAASAGTDTTAVTNAA